MSSFEHYLEQIRRPVRDDTPLGGRIPRNNEDYRQLRRKIAMFTPGMAKPKSDEESSMIWREILNHAVHLLKDVSKDILVFNYTSVAMFMNFGVKALLETLKIFLFYMNEHYDAMSPEKPRLRANAFSWLGLFLEYRFAVMGRDMTSESVVAMSDDEAKAWRELPDVLKEMCAFVGEHIDPSIDLDEKFIHLPELAGNFAELAAKEMRKRKAEREKEEKKEKMERPVETHATTPPLEPAVETDKASETSASPLPETSQVLSDSVGSVHGEQKSSGEVPSISVSGDIDRRTISAMLRKILPALLKADPEDPLPYGLNRVMVWSAIKNLPRRQPGKASDKTFLQKPTDIAFVLTNVKNVDEGKLSRLEPVAAALELQMAKPGMAFWLDLQRIQVYFMKKLGWTEARKMIESETLAFINRMGGDILTLCFSDGTPFADASTQNWIHSLQDGHTSPHGAIDTSSTISKSDKPTAMTSSKSLKTDVPRIAVAGGTFQHIIKELEREPSFLRRWLLVVQAGKQLAADERTAGMALAVLQSCRRKAEEIVLKEAVTDVFVDVMVLIHKVQEKLSSGKPVLDLKASYAEYVHEALWLNPAEFLISETA